MRGCQTDQVERWRAGNLYRVKLCCCATMWIRSSRWCVSAGSGPGSDDPGVEGCGPQKQHGLASKITEKACSLRSVGVRKPGVGVLVAYLGGDRRAVAGMNAVTAYGVDGIPHHRRHSGTRGEAPVCRVCQMCGRVRTGASATVRVKHGGNSLGGRVPL